MPELETLFVRIETDLSAFKRGMAEARRETQDFAKEARSTFSSVGDALDLRKFRDQLTATETAAKQSAERMKKAFGDVAIAQKQAAQKAVQNLFKAPFGSGTSNPVDSSARSGQTFGSSKVGSLTTFDLSAALQGAGFAALLITAFAIPITATAIAAIAGSALLSGTLTPQLEKMFGEDSNERLTLDEQIEKLNSTIQGLLNQEGRAPRQPRPGMGPTRDERLEAARKELRAAETLRDAIQEQQRQARATATQYQDFLGAFTELSACLRELCTRIDELAPLTSGGAAAPRPDQLGFGGAGAGAGGGFIQASFGGGSPFAGAGLAHFNRELEATGWHAGDAGKRIAELTERAGGYRAEAGALLRVLRENNVAFDDQVGVVRLLDALMPELGEAMTGVFTESSAAGRELDRVFEGESFRDVLLKIIQDLLVLSQASLGGGGGGGSSFNLSGFPQQAVGAEPRVFRSVSRTDQGIRTTTRYSARNANRTTRPTKKISPFSRYLVQCTHWGAVRPTVSPQSPHVSVVM